MALYDPMLDWHFHFVVRAVVWFVPFVSGGDASLQNGLELCQELMSGVPPYGHKEVLMLMAALSIVDPGRVEDSILACKAAHIR